MDLVMDCNLLLENSNGGILIENVITKMIDVKTTNAKIKIDSVKSNQCDCKTTNGSIQVRDGAFATRLSTQSSNGALKVDGIIATDIAMKTTNGSIKGSIIGNDSDYEIYSKTTNGSNNMPKEWGIRNQKKLSAVTSNGPIHLEFIK